MECVFNFKLFIMLKENCFVVLKLLNPLAHDKKLKLWELFDVPVVHWRYLRAFPNSNHLWTAHYMGKKDLYDISEVEG